MRRLWLLFVIPLVAVVLAACHPAQTNGIWMNNSAIDSLPTSGAAWTALNNEATATNTFQPVCNQDSNHDSRILAKALVGTRTNNGGMQFAAIGGIANAIGTEESYVPPGGSEVCGSSGSTLPRWLSVGRNLGAYVIAADVLRSDGVTNANVDAWFEDFLDGTITLQNNNNPNVQEPLSTAAWNSGANASAQQGFVRSALAAYLGNTIALASEFTRFQRYVGDRNSTYNFGSNLNADQADWHQDPDTNHVGIVQAGATRGGCQWDGAIVYDIARIGAYACNIPWQGDAQYSWVGLMGAVPAAVILERAGFHAFEAQNNALNRALDFLWDKRQLSGDAEWFDGQRANQAIWLVNGAYCEDWLFDGPTGGGQTVGFVDWTHPNTC